MDEKSKPAASKPIPERDRKPLTAKKAHVVHQNEHHFEIKKGDDVSHVPAHLLVALRTEGVID